MLSNRSHGRVEVELKRKKRQRLCITTVVCTVQAKLVFWGHDYNAVIFSPSHPCKQFTSDGHAPLLLKLRTRDHKLLERASVRTACAVASETGSPQT